MDQTLTTAAIVNRGLCTLPGTHSIWKDKSFREVMARAEPTNDTLTCYKGDDNGHQCLSHIKDDHCTWAHFLPTVDRDHLIKVYEEIAMKHFGYVAAKDLLT